MTLFLVQARLRRDASVAALAPLLMPEDAHERALAAHRLAWSLMPADPDAKRDFLWREEAPGRFMLLAARPPAPSTLFDIACKPFAPELAVGDRLHFVLRANPTVARHQPGRRGRREDVVMHALYALPGKPEGGRPAARAELIVSQGTAWLTKLGERHGFVADTTRLAVDGYQLLSIPRAPGTQPIQFATLDFQGLLTVTDPATFVAKLAHGFGRARAFGCGLMLIRRAPHLDPDEA